MQQGLFRRNPLLRGINEKLADQIDGLRRGVRQNLFEGNRRIFGKSDFVVIREFGHPRPRFLRRRAQDAQHAAQLLDVVFAGEKRGIVEQFAEDAADGPQVHALVVFSGAVEQLGSSARGDFWILEPEIWFFPSKDPI